ncbi:MAG: hypothetical protein SFU56_09545 [Capsulimonadales bacterium]|nr:hypothetical protein [Capsulimonadales bacterium]
MKRIPSTAYVCCYFLLGIAITATYYLPATAQTQKARSGYPTLTVSSPSGAAGKTVKIKASLKSKAGKPMAKRELTFSARWNRKQYTEIGSAETDAKGQAEIEATIPSETVEGVRSSTVYITGRVAFSGDTEPQDGYLHIRKWRSFTIVVTVPKQEPEEEEKEPSDGASAVPTATNAAATNPDATQPVASQKDAPVTDEEKTKTDEEETKVDEEETKVDTPVGVTPPGVLPPSQSSAPSQMGIELRTILKERATGENPLDPAFAKLGLSADAVAVKKDNFAPKPARFWVSARLLQFKPDTTSTIPGQAETKVTIQLMSTFVDAYTGVRHDRIFQTKEKSQTFNPSGIKIPGLEGANKVIQDLTTGGISGQKADSATEKAVLKMLFRSEQGGAVRKALGKMLEKEVFPEIQSADWMLKVLQANDDEIILSSGEGTSLKAGDRLIIKKSRIIVDPGNPEIIIDVQCKDIGEAEVTEVKANFITAKPIKGTIVPGLLAFRQTTDTPKPGAL